MHKTSFVLPVVASFAIACGGGGGGEATTPQHPADQVAWGQDLYGKHCASCHGDHGQGGGAPAVVGKDALPLDNPSAKFRKGQFHTAKDVFDFVKANMPPNKGGSLTDDEYAAILAFDLKANGVDLAGKHVDATTAASFVLHP
jgi:mono/diheme cytochrome c family protein